MTRILLLTFFGILVSCNSIGESPKENPLDLNGLKIDLNIVTDISNLTKKSPVKNSVIRYRPSDSTYRVYEPIDSLVTGIKFEFVDEMTAYEIIDKHFDEVKKSNNYLFLSNLDFDKSYNSYYDIVIAPISNQIDLLKFVGTEAGNYDLLNDDIINWFEKKQTEFDFEIVVVELDRVEAKIISEPKSYENLAKEIFEFCPDVIYQGHSDLNELVDHLRTNKYMWFWWD